MRYFFWRVYKNRRTVADMNLETGQLSRYYIAEISLNVTLNYNKANQTIRWGRGDVSLGEGITREMN